MPSKHWRQDRGCGRKERKFVPLSSALEQQYKELSQKPDSVFGQCLFFLSSFLQSAVESCFPRVVNEVTFRSITNMKDIEKVKEKVDRPDRRVIKFKPGETISRLQDLIDEIEDLVRGRVIVDYISQAETIIGFIKGSAITSKWPITDEADHLHNPKDNGYRAQHITLEVGTPYGPCNAEIQIQTINQFSWASKTHGLLYKPSVEPEPHMKVIMKHLSDCLHVNDLLFEVVREYNEETKKP